MIADSGSADSTPSLLDPLGPWNIESYLKLPECSTKVNFSTNHDRANITVSHVLKVMLRVERGDDDFLDSKGKRKVSFSVGGAASQLTISSHSCGMSLSNHPSTSSPVAAPPTLCPPIRLQGRYPASTPSRLLALQSALTPRPLPRDSASICTWVLGHLGTSTARPAAQPAREEVITRLQSPPSRRVCCLRGSLLEKRRQQERYLRRTMLH